MQLVQDPKHRAQYINFTEDWWYVDDLAEEYFKVEKMEEVFVVHKKSASLRQFQLAMARTS
jgi:hypothetical protein